MSFEKSIVLLPKQGYMEMYAYSETISHSFCSKAVLVLSSLHDVRSRAILLADSTSVTGTQQNDGILQSANGNMLPKDLQLVPDLEYNLISVGRLADRASSVSFARVMCAWHIIINWSPYGEKCSKKTALYTFSYPGIHFSAFCALSVHKDNLAQV